MAGGATMTVMLGHELEKPPREKPPRSVETPRNRSCQDIFRRKLALAECRSGV